MDPDRENKRLEFLGGHVYVCFYCEKVLDEREDLKIHIDDDHDEFVEDEFLDGPQFKIRKFKFYQQQVLYDKGSPKKNVYFKDIVLTRETTYPPSLIRTY